MRIVCVLGILVFLPATAAAQFPSEVHTGARVRVWLPEPYMQAEGPARRQLLRGVVESVGRDSMRLAVPRAGTLSIPRSSIRRIEVSRGTSRIATAVERAVGGAIGGAITFGLMNDPKRTGGPHYRTDWRAAGVGAGWGAGIGAVLGFIAPVEQWRRVRL